ncbi:ABC transporter permease [Advenella faeciporci]|uniref:ABC transporter permease n=2 Tax=Advenella faeciporci TaxID=797535 RepID=A0A918JK26_9BURK|nr:ABC transporter permease [Advenella faeciporci]
MSQMAITKPAMSASEAAALQIKFSKSTKRNKVKAFGLVLPLVLFLLLLFVAPILAFLNKSIENPEVVSVLPITTQQLSDWEVGQPLQENFYKALAQDLATAKQARTSGDLMRRLNFEEPGARSLLSKTVRRMPLPETVASYRDEFEKIDASWTDPATWALLKRNSGERTAFYLLTALDMKYDKRNEIVSAGPSESIFLDIYLRTFKMALVVTLCTLILAYPLAYLLATLPAKTSNLLMILVLLPFWTSLLVRTAAWIVLLQNGGIINGFLIWAGIIEQPVQLVFNRIGVYIAMVHIMLPFMILPIYSVMKGISPTYIRAAVSLGCHPITSFWKVYFPQTVAGISAGCLLVFITSIGYYITPALLGGPKDQMISYFIAFYTNGSINWGLAAALGGFLLVATLILYAVYNRLVGSGKVRLA